MDRLGGSVRGRERFPTRTGADTAGRARWWPARWRPSGWLSVRLSASRPASRGTGGSRADGEPAERSDAFRIAALTLALLLAVSVVPGVAVDRGSPAPEGVTPAVVERSLDPGESTEVVKEVRTPVVPPRPDVVLFVDRTNSMNDTINKLKEGFKGIADAVREAQPDSRFAVAGFGDVIDKAEVFGVPQGFTHDVGAVKLAIDELDVELGKDSPGPAEDWINALWQIAHGADGKTRFRESASPVVVLIGDASSHYPSVGHSLSHAINALQDISARVIAVDIATSLGDWLNGNGDNGNGPGQNGEPTHEPNQATKVIQATNGTLFQGIDPGQVAEKITEGLTNLPTTVSHQPVNCDPALRVRLEPESQQVTSGQVATFRETIELAEDAPQGAAVECGVQFLLDGKVPDPDSTVHGSLFDDALQEPGGGDARTGPTDGRGERDTVTTVTGGTTAGTHGGQHGTQTGGVLGGTLGGTTATSWGGHYGG